MKVKDFDYETTVIIASNYDRGRIYKVFNLAQGKSVVRVCKPYNLEGEQEVREYPLADFQSAIDFYNS